MASPDIQIAVLLNPASGGGSREETADRIIELFAARGRVARISRLGQGVSVADTVRRAIEAGAVAVVAAGGDGTVSAVAAELIRSETPLGVIPAGTLNHFAKDLGVPLDLEGAVEVIASGKVTAIDVGEVNDRVFINNSSIGVYPRIVELRDEYRKKGVG
ncbi:MAG: diacylglycerol kinase family protein, partial [Gemmatimonadales bacterium]